jgi:hypothetical protein
MSSWTLLRHLFLFRQQYHHNPVFRRESWRQFYLYGYSLPELWVRALIAISGIVWWVLAFQPPEMPTTLCLFLAICIPLGVWFIAYPLVVLVGVSTLSPAIVRERAQHTWETLRVTPLPVEAIVLGKAHAAIFKLHNRTVWILTVLTLGIGSLMTAGVLLLQRVPNSPVYDEPAIDGPAVLLLLVSGLLFFVERAQQAALFSAAALAVSASARSTRSALAGTLASTVLLWTADLMIVELLVRALPRHGETLPVAVCGSDRLSRMGC